MINLFKKILLIDDDQSIQKIMRVGFDTYNETQQKNKQIEFDQINNGRDALSYLITNHDQIGLILLDIEMPVIDGWQTLQLIKENPMLSNIPVIIFSSHSGDQFEARLKKLGAIGYINKPECMGELSNVITRIDRMRRMGRIARISKTKQALEQCVSSSVGSILLNLESSLSETANVCRRATDHKIQTHH